MLTALSLCVLLSATYPEPACPGVFIEQVFTPADPGGQYKHPACIEQLDNGDLYLAFYGGNGEYDPDTKDWGSRQKQGETKWSVPQIIADTPFRSDGNPVVFQAPDGLVWLYYNMRPGDTWSTTRIFAKVSRDGANTWSDPLVVAFEQGMMVRSRPIVLDDGDYLLPIYHETGFDREVVGPDTTSLFLRQDPKTNTFTETNRIESRLGNLQPSVVQLTKDHLVCYCRRASGYEPMTDAWMVRAESNDGGHTWSKGVETNVPNPNAAVEFIRLANGHLMRIYNDSMNERAPLVADVSTDGDKTYPFKKTLVEAPGDYGYPYAIQTKDGKIHLVFTSNERSVVNHCVFEEGAITGEK